MSTESRVRTAAEATAASVGQIRPLTLPDSSAVPAELPQAAKAAKVPRITPPSGKLKETWIIPLGAAAARGGARADPGDAPQPGAPGPR